MKTRLLLSSLLTLSALIVAHAAPEALANTNLAAQTSPDAAVPERETRTIAGWTVHVSRELLIREPQLTERALELLQKQLEEIGRVVPAPAVAELQKVPLYFSPEYPGVKPRAEFHPDAGWLREHGRDPAMAKAVEFTDVRNFEREMNRMPNFALHELAHAYQNRVLPQGFDNPEIKAAYAKAKTSGKYDRVERWHGNGQPNTFERAYAMVNAMEYFAETSEAFFSRNDFYPFTRDELKQQDLQMFALLEKLWSYPPNPAVAAVASASPKLIPWPKSVQISPGEVSLSSQTRMVVSDAPLKPLADVLEEEILLATGLRLARATASPAAGDIVLRIDPLLEGEAYALSAGGPVEVRGGSYGAVALGTVTLLQALRLDGGKVLLPRVSVSDAPAAEFRGLLVDVARRYHSIENLKQMVRLCRLYKIRYLQLHLTDDQSFMFPSRAFPQLATKNQHGGKTYTLEELKDLVAFADARGVTIIPEYEVPGHSAAANRAMPDLFLIRGTKPYEHHASINFAKEEVMLAVATIVGEMCEVFKSSPYFHIGGDEADLALANQNEDFKAAFMKFNLPNQHQLYRKFVADLHEIVKKHGKQMIVWEGFGRERNSPVQIPKDVIVMAYEIRFYMPDQLVKDGYPVVNASWTPLYVVNRGRPPEEIYAWHLRQFKPFGAKPSDLGVIVPPEGQVFGAQMCAWEQPEIAELPNERLRLPAMSERIWNPAAGKTYPDFARRLAATDQLLDWLVHHFTVHAEGLLNFGESRFDQPITLTLALSPATRGTIRYTLDGQEPSTHSPTYAGPMRLTTTTDFTAQAFDETNLPIDYPRFTRYEFHPIRSEARGLLGDDRFSEPLTLSLKSAAPGEIHFTLDGKDPKTNSPLYAAPLTIEQSAKVRAALFVAGKRQGEPWAQDFTRVNYEKNLTTGKPVKASGVEAEFRAENAVDGVVDLNSAWWAGPYPQWLQVDLEKTTTLERIQVFPYWGGRYYQYTVEVSVDGQNWTQVADMSRNTKPATPQGDLHSFAQTQARYLRVNMLKNSANTGVHLVEVRAYEAK